MNSCSDDDSDDTVEISASETPIHSTCETVSGQTGSKHHITDRILLVLNYKILEAEHTMTTKF